LRIANVIHGARSGDAASSISPCPSGEDFAPCVGQYCEHARSRWFRGSGSQQAGSDENMNSPLIAKPETVDQEIGLASTQQLTPTCLHGGESGVVSVRERIRVIDLARQYVRSWPWPAARNVTFGENQGKIDIR